MFENTRTGKFMDKEHSLSLMEVSMKVVGRVEKNMDKEPTLSRMGKCMKANSGMDY